LFRLIFIDLQNVGVISAAPCIKIYIKNSWTYFVLPIWSYGIELWGCVTKSSVVIMQRFQSKILRTVSYSPWYVTNHTLHTDFSIPYVSDVTYERINKDLNNLEAHPSPLLEPLLQPINTRRLKRCWPLELKVTW